LNFALDVPREDWPVWLRGALPEGDYMSLHDAAAGIHRAAVLRDGRLEAVLLTGPLPKLPSPDWLKTLFAHAAIPPGMRRNLLSGQPGEGATDEGPIVCVCFQVGAKRIELAASQTDCRSVEAVGRKIGAGTNCGSCIPEIRRLIASEENARDPC
jgi:assimilatory nitrate reductase catalytic subunit